MREFSEFEKKVLSKMTYLQKEGKLCRYYILCDISSDIVIEKINSCDIQVASNTIEKSEIRKILIQLSFLIKYLIDSYYLCDLKRDVNAECKVDLKGDSSKKYKVTTDRSYPDEFFIFDYNCFYELLLSETVVDLVNNTFKSVEQRRFEKQLADSQKKHNCTMRWTYAAFFISLVAAISAIVSIFISLFKDTTIDESQVKEITYEIRNLNTSIQNDVSCTDDTIKIDFARSKKINKK